MGNCFGCSVRSELVHLRAVVKRYESGSEYEKIQKEYRKQIAEMEDRLARHVGIQYLDFDFSWF